MKQLWIFILLLVFILPGWAQCKNETSSKRLGITFSFPWINNYSYVDYEKNKVMKQSGFFGLGIAAYYKINEHTRIAINSGLTNDLSSPIGAIPYYTEGIHSSISNGFGELIVLPVIYENLSLVAGGNFSSYIYHLSSFVDSIPSYEKVDHTLGLTLGIEYRLNKLISVAAIYRPAMASFETDNLYRHVITFDVRVDLDILKIEKK